MDQQRVSYSNLDGKEMQYCLVVNNQQSFTNLCEAVLQSLRNPSPGTCSTFEFLHDGFLEDRKHKNKQPLRFRLGELNYKGIPITIIKNLFFQTQIVLPS